MDPKLQSYLSILTNTATLLANPVLGINGGRAVALLQYASSVYQDLASTADDLKEVDDEVKRLVSEGRVPTDEEWLPWEAKLKAVSDRFQKVKESLPPKG